MRKASAIGWLPTAELLLIRLLTEVLTYYHWYSNPKGKTLNIQRGQFVIKDHDVTPPGDR